MSPRSAALLSALLLCLSSASSQFVCPVSNKADTSCFCTSACSVGGDTVFPWAPPAYPVPSVDVGTDTICASVLIPCVNTSSYNALTRWLGVNGDVQFDNNASNDWKGCGPNTVVEIATAFSTAECAAFAALWLALPAPSAGTPPATVYTCTTNNCNSLGLAAFSGSMRSAVSSGVALVAAALALAATF